MGRSAAKISPDDYLSAKAPKVDVDNRIPLRNYYRIANNLLKQANIYREEKNVIDLYVILVRYSSLVLETIPFHQDYRTLFSKERTLCTRKVLDVLKELEALKPEFRRQLEELDIQKNAAPPMSASFTLEWPVADHETSSSCNDQRLIQSSVYIPPMKQNNGSNIMLPRTSIDKQFQKLSVCLPLPKQETLSRHSILGPNGLRGQWQGPSSEIKVSYPTYTDLASAGNSRLVQVEQDDSPSKVDVSEPDASSMASVLSLDDGRWVYKAEEPDHPLHTVSRYDNFPLIEQPSVPPVLARVKPECRPISPSRVADPRPGPAKSSSDEISSSNTYQHLHVPVKMMEDFLRLAKENTARNLETCGVLAGSLRNRMFHLTTLIIPKQESTSDSCQTLNEEEIFEVQDKLSLFPLGWIHTHPTQTCFMSSVDLHTHYSYQVMLPEAIAIVMAPTDTSSPHGIFHLSDPGGVAIIRNCQQRGFHPHEEPGDGSPIYEHCSHVYMNSNLKYDVMDLR